MRRSERYDAPRARRAVLVVTARRAARPGILWGLVFGGTVAATMTQYSSLFPDAASRARLALSVQGNAGFEALFGKIHAIDTVAGYTAYKTLFTLMVLGAIWGLLLATRVTRGEEDAGRWELLRSGRTTAAGAAAQAAAGLGAGVVCLWLPTATFAMWAGGADKVGVGAGPALYFATAAVAGAAMFMGIGLAAGQLAPTRHDANVIGAGVMAASYLVRMVADSDASLGWLRWASPFGWIEELRPLTGSHPAAFVPVVVLVAASVAVALAVAARRDLGASALAGRDTPPARTFLLSGQAGLTIRLTRATVVVWLLALAGTGLVFGLVTQAAGNAAKGSATLERVIARLGASGAGAVVYLGFVFLMAAGMVAIAVAGQVAALRNEEATGHLDNLLVRRVARWRWLAARLAVGVGLVVLASAAAGLAAWVGAASQHAAVGFGDLLVAGLNVAPPAVFVLGIGCLVFGIRPRAAVAVTYGLVVWSFLVEIVASVVDSGQWLRDTSPLLHIAPAPAADPNWTAAGWLVGLGALAALAGIAAFSRRDLQGA
ncbi:MAG TPA: hypothetical protein VFJ85_10335 [Acidimicrobiales bacterium]|nr:hypothetical protein [Acidimicrobiales bacterium]